MRRARILWVSAGSAALVVLTGLVLTGLLLATARAHRRSLTVTPNEVTLPADGAAHHAASIRVSHTTALASQDFQVSSAALQIAANPGSAEIIVRTPVNPGVLRASVRYGNQVRRLGLYFIPSFTDSFGDGTPDFLRLHSNTDRAAFRMWFAVLADAAANLPPAGLPKEINDCAALLRWCYRNALHAHNEAWLHDMPFSTMPPFPAISQYTFPETPTGTGLLRTTSGPFTSDDLHNGAFQQFADAKTLWQRNTFLVSRNIRDARTGDLLFYRQLEQNSPYHSMIVTGRNHDWVVYDTGPIGSAPGEVRRVTMNDLLDHPDTRWRPLSGNSNFLGVYRWNILREDAR